MNESLGTTHDKASGSSKEVNSPDHVVDLTPARHSEKETDLTPARHAEEESDLTPSPETNEAPDAVVDVTPPTRAVDELVNESKIGNTGLNDTTSIGNTDHDLTNSGVEEPVEGLMTVVEHLDELRWRIIRSTGYIAVAFIAALFVTKDIIKYLEAPAGPIPIIALSIEEPVLVFIKVAFYTALIAASPFILFEVSKFISPGLTRKERAVMAPIVVGSPVLFIAGAAFAYYLLLPPMLHFFNSFGVGVTPINQRLDFYISLVSSIMLYLGLCFQLPILIFALSFTGIVNSRMLISIWKYAVAGITVVAAIVTPDPTAMSMLMVMAALIGLYFLSVLLLKLFGR